MVYCEINKDIQMWFRVSSRNNIPRKRFDEAVEYIQRWKPSTNTVMLIQQSNGQTSMFSGMSERITMKGVAECCEMFRANLVPMSPSKFWNNVAHGEYDGWVVPREDTKRRQATIYIDGFIDYMHRHGRKIVRPYENYKEEMEI